MVIPQIAQDFAADLIRAGNNISYELAGLVLILAVSAVIFALVRSRR